MVANLFLTKTGFAILLGVLFQYFRFDFPVLAASVLDCGLLDCGCVVLRVDSVAEFAPLRARLASRAELHTVPNSIIVVAMLLAVTFTARGMSVEDIRQVQTASFITLVMMGLWNLAAVARPFNRARVLLFRCVAGGVLRGVVRADSGGVPPVRY